MRRPFVPPALALVTAIAFGSAHAGGLEIQGYPAGLTVGASYTRDAGERLSVALLAGWNFTDRRDFGEHAAEHGGGPGFGLAAWRWRDPGRTGWGAGLRADVWWLDIEWRDEGRRGRTDVVVLQPTARAGHAWLARGGRLRLEASISLGAEINAHTRGEEVGEGAILLAGVAVLM